MRIGRMAFGAAMLAASVCVPPARCAPPRPPEESLVFLADLEKDGVVFVRGREEPAPFAPWGYVDAGRFGRGYHFQEPGRNLLPAAAADVETDLAHFSPAGGGRLSCAPGSPFGARAVAIAMPLVRDGFSLAPGPCPLDRQAGHEKRATLLASVYVKGPPGSDIRLDLRFAPVSPPADPKTRAPVSDLLPDRPTPQTVALTGGWQRVAVSAACDARFRSRTPVLSIVSADPKPLALLADGFQFEQAAYYPSSSRLMPTPWIPGGTSRPSTVVDLTAPAVVNAFPVREGTISFWYRAFRESNLDGVAPGNWLCFIKGWKGYDGVAWELLSWRVQAGVSLRDGKPGPIHLGGTLDRIRNGAWHHVGLVWDAAEGRLYRNGRLVVRFDRRPDVPDLAEYRLRLGGGIGGGAASADGVMDEIAIFDRALGEDEIAGLVRRTTPLCSSR